MRTSSVFAVCCLAVGITPSNGYHGSPDAQHHPGDPLPSIDHSQHRKTLLEQWEQRLDAYHTHLDELPKKPSNARILETTNFLQATEPLRNSLEKLSKDDPSIDSHLALIDETRRQLRVAQTGAPTHQ
ncbi:hypothetical protein F5148DRAFT_1220707 [Russula earlei]|uniref:Uncharacterized protein n=1 Tax=Russula earlei TaxID=71964 RepID=A0ACC0U2Q5_9AGAM|nr:hypothetical protein F5148DRAFT_1220707 [Russula earlei]